LVDERVSTLDEVRPIWTPPPPPPPPPPRQGSASRRSESRECRGLLRGVVVHRRDVLVEQSVRRMCVCVSLVIRLSSTPSKRHPPHCLSTAELVHLISVLDGCPPKLEEFDNCCVVRKLEFRQPVSKEQLLKVEHSWSGLCVCVCPQTVTFALDLTPLTSSLITEYLSFGVVVQAKMPTEQVFVHPCYSNSSRRSHRSRPGFCRP